MAPNFSLTTFFLHVPNALLDRYFLKRPRELSAESRAGLDWSIGINRVRLY
jgi:hypothetical protein